MTRAADVSTSTVGRCRTIDYLTGAQFSASLPTAARASPRASNRSSMIGSAATRSIRDRRLSPYGHGHVVGRARATLSEHGQVAGDARQHDAGRSALAFEPADPTTAQVIPTQPDPVGPAGAGDNTDTLN